MHKKILSICLLLLTFSVFTSAQDKEQPARPNVPGTLLFDIGFNTLMDNDDVIDLGVFGSKTVNIYYLYDIRLGSSKFFFLPGFGLGLDKYKFDDDVTLDIPTTNADTTLVADISAIGSIKKSKLAVNYIDIPLEFHFYANPEIRNRGFHAGIGGKIGVMYTAHTKIKYEFDDHTNKIKHKRDFNLSRIRYGVTARVGYGSFGLFTYYGLNELFEDGKGPEDSKMKTLTFGLTINGF